MTRTGLVLGGGGVAGASFQIAALMALEMACGWEADEADVVVGTSAGAYVAALLRAGRLDLDSLVLPDEDPPAVAERIRRNVFVSRPSLDMGRWVRQGLLPGLRRPGLTTLVGCPARYSPEGIARWVRQQVGAVADSWPDRTTLVSAYDVARRDRVAFGAEPAPRAALAEAVAASSAIPLLFHPHTIAGNSYVDGGVASGTHLDLVLTHSPPLDLVIVIAPMAPPARRDGAWPHERFLDRLGRKMLAEERAQVEAAWPGTDILVFLPSPSVLDVMRPNPMAGAGAVPTFMRTLAAMRRELADPGVWNVLQRHLAVGAGAA